MKRLRQSPSQSLSPAAMISRPGPAAHFRPLPRGACAAPACARAGGLCGSSMGHEEPSAPGSCPLHPQGPQAADRLLSEILSGEAEGENSSDYAGGRMGLPASEAACWEVPVL